MPTYATHYRSYTSDNKLIKDMKMHFFKDIDRERIKILPLQDLCKGNGFYIKG